MRNANNNKKQFLFFIAFVAIGFLLLQIPLTRLAGSKATFTLFDAFGPTAGGFLGGPAGALAALLMQLSNFLAHGAQIQDAGTLVRLVPMMFAALYFGRKTRLNVLVPIIAIIAFVAHPVGREVWFFSLFWLIPIVCSFFQERFLLARALGATFTAHAVGGALWIYFVPLPAAVWVALIPIVIVERLAFTAGIAISYIALNNAFRLLNKKEILPFQFPVQEKYSAPFLRNTPSLR